MPWDAKSFAGRHNHALHGERASHAARIANAVLRSGVPEGESIAIANKYAKRHPRRAVGGNAPQVSAIPTAAPNVNAQGFVPVPQTGTYNLDLTTGAMTPGTNQALQTLAQRGLPITGSPGSTAAGGAGAANPFGFAGQPTTGPVATGNPNDPYGIYAFALQQAMAGRGYGGGGGGEAGPVGGGVGNQAGAGVGTSNVGGVAGNSAELAAAMGGANTFQAHGGRIPKRQTGGMLSMSQATPWWTRREASGEGSHAPAGFLRGPTGGKADAVAMGLAPHSHVIPAAVVSHWGQGNGEAGAANLEHAFKTGPFGSSLPKAPTRAPSMPRAPAMPRYAKGGGIPEHEGGRITMVSHGELIVPPEDVHRIGGGDYNKGHDWLDRLIVQGHRDLAKAARDAPPPVKER